MQICTVLNFTRIKRPVLVALPAVCGAGFMQLSGTHLSIPSGCHTPLRRVCCCGPGEQEILMNCCMACSSSSGRMRVVHVVGVHRKPNTDWFLSKKRRVLLHPRRGGGGIKRYRDPSACLSQPRLRWLPAASRPPDMHGLQTRLQTAVL